ncbi:uncharacterized protein LOC123291542 isoform X2 [Chrysoperla carnea]|uniref:uncharacterized protein LOC123291542 isoform X2 n=1 Tax=Chrysoperla carnea TaxID=189513 RepID=UPI001D072E86|nr:uncharacterized protein LOC123291542 isoform X2 [Chrysoperla carnea]
MEESNTKVQSLNNPPQTNREIIYELQNKLCEILSDRDFDLFMKDEHKELYKTVGYALFGPPSILNESETDAGYTKKQQEKIDPIYQAILKYGSYDRLPGVIYMATIFVFGEKLNSKNGDVFQVPVFRIRKCHKKLPEYDCYLQLCDAKAYGQYIVEKTVNYCTVFIDDDARVYESWQQYLENNTLPKCKMYVPTDGKYQARILDEKKEMEVMLDIKLSPSCTLLQRAANTADIVGTVGGIGSMAICGAAAIPAVAVAPVVLGGAAVVATATGVYSACRAVAGLYNRKKHKQTVGLKNAEARGHWLNVGGGIAAGTAAGASQLISRTVSSGATVGMGTRAFFNIATGANLIVNGSAVVNSLYVFKVKHDNNERISNLEIIQFTTSMLFFAHAAWNVRTANTFINETQANVLMEYEANLSSKNKRSMFNKALLESERTKGTQAGRAEMIRGLKTITNHDEFFGTLVRNNKMFNENNARFTVSPDGKIQVNTNMLIDSSEFATMSVASKQNLFANLPENPVNAPNVVRTTNPQSNVINSSQFRNELLQFGISIGKIALRYSPNVEQIVNEIFNYFESDIREKLEDVLSYIHTKINDLTDDIQRIFRYTDQILVVLQFLFQYLEEYLRIYGSNQTMNINFCDVKPNALLRSIFTNKDKVLKFIFIIKTMDKTFIDEIIESFREWIQFCMQKFWSKYRKMMNEISESIQNDCPICKGVYYSVV